MNEFLTQGQLAEKLVQRTGVSLDVAKKFSSVFFTIVKTGLKNSTSFSVYNFGTFKKTWIEDSVGINPSSGEKIDIPAHWRIKFVPSAAVAKRINRPYAHLKPRVATEKDLKNPTLTTSMPSAANENNLDANNLDGDEEEFFYTSAQYENPAENKKNGFWLKILGLGAVALLLLAFLISIFVKTCSSSKDSKEKLPKTPVKKESNSKVDSEKTLQEAGSGKEPKNAEKAQDAEENAELAQAQRLFEYYVVKTGSDYHSIAQEIYGNRHLWPVLYSCNKNSNPDPDFVASYSNIKIPELPQNQEEKNRIIEKAVLEAYNGYLLMCEKESESPKNEKRHRLAVRTLVSGEILVPGFIDKNNNRILPEYALMAKNIASHQYR